MKKVLVVLSGHGYWGEELVGPLDAIDKAGYETVFFTPAGTRPQPLPPSTDPNYVDPPLGRPVTTAEMADRVKALDASPRLNNPGDLSKWLPERPYLSAPNYLRDLEAYYHALEAVDQDIKPYAALLLVGGSGPIVDMVNNQRLHDLILAFLKVDKPVAAECYGVACLAFARDVRIRKSIIWGRHVTGHPIEYDYKDGTGFIGTDFNMGPPPYPLEYILRDAVGPDGQYYGNVGNTTSVIVDYPFITSRSTSESTLCGIKLIEVLDKGSNVMAGNSSERNGNHAIIEQFLADGIRYMFGNPGTVEEGFLDALKDYPDFKYVLALHESVAVSMADGFARVSKQPALVQLHSSAGLGNGIGMMYQAMRGHSPIVVIASDGGVKYDAMDAQMAVDLVAMTRPVTKYSTRVTDSSSVLRVLRRAIKMAVTPPEGPVFVALPLDVLDALSSEDIVPAPKLLTRVAPEESAMAPIAQALAAAENPMIITGDAIASSQASAELTKIAELTGAAVWGADSSEVNISGSHPLFCGLLGHMFGSQSSAITSQADVVLITGTYVFPEVFPALSGVFKKGARVFHIDLNSYEMAKNFPVDIGIVADPKVSLALLARMIEEVITPEQKQAAMKRSETLGANKRTAIESQKGEDLKHVTETPIRPATFMKTLSEKLPVDSIIFDEALTASSDLVRYMPANVPGRYFQTRGGSLGVGVPGALGIKLACPEQTVIGFSGDGGAMYTIQALWSAAHHGIGAKFVICNNQSYKLLKLNILQYWKERGITQHAFPDSFSILNPCLHFDSIARSLGVPALRVEKPEQIGPAIDEMLSTNGPFLIDLVTYDDTEQNQIGCKCGQ